MAPQARELERELSGGVARESGIEYSAVVVVTERPGVDWLDFVLFDWERYALVDEDNTGGLNSASMIASVSWTVLSRVPAGLRFIGWCGAESRLDEDVEDTVDADAEE